MGEITRLFEIVAVKLRPIGVGLVVVVACLFIWLVVSGGIFEINSLANLGLMWAGGAAFIYTLYYPGEPFSIGPGKQGVSSIRKAPMWMQKYQTGVFLFYLLFLIIFTVSELWG